MLNFRTLRATEITECDHLKSCKAFFKKSLSPVALFIMLREVLLNYCMNFCDIKESICVSIC